LGRAIPVWRDLRELRLPGDELVSGADGFGLSDSLHPANVAKSWPSRTAPRVTSLIRHYSNPGMT